MAVTPESIIEKFKLDSYLCSMLGGYTLKTYMMNKRGWSDGEWNSYHNIYVKEIGKNQQ
jgi:hypothetical protein